MSFEVLSEKIKQENWDWGFDGVFAYPNIPQKKLLNAIASYAKNIHPEDVVILIDDTVFGGAKEGVLVTNSAIYSKQLFESPKKVDFRPDLEIKPGTDARIIIDKKEFFKASTVNHLTMLTTTSRIASIFSKEKNNEITDQNSNHTTDKNNNIPHENKNKETLDPKRDSIFHTHKNKFMQILHAQQIPRNLITLNSQLYDISLTISMINDKKDQPVDNRLLRVFFNDETIFETIIYSYFTAVRLLNVHIGEEKSQAMLMPLFLAALFYYIETESTAETPTLKSAINPLSLFTESKTAKKFKQNAKLYFLGYNSNEDGIDVSRENFKSNIIESLIESNKEDKEFAYGLYSNDAFDHHISKQLPAIEKSIEVALINFFDGNS